MKEHMFAEYIVNLSRKIKVQSNVITKEEHETDYGTFSDILQKVFGISECESMALSVPAWF